MPFAADNPCRGGKEERANYVLLESGHLMFYKAWPSRIKLCRVHQGQELVRVQLQL